MKKLLFTFLIILVSLTLQAQLANTKWKTTLIINNPVNAIFYFKADTLLLYTVADSSMIETMKYTMDDTSFTLNKINGQSDCNNNVPGRYHFKLKGDFLLMDLISDDCYDRSSVINSTKWIKWREHKEVKLNEAILKRYTGIYQSNEAHPITISYENGRLYAEGPNNNLPKSPLIAVNETKFFLKVAGVEWDFVKDEKGRVIKIISHEEKDYELKKVK